MLVAIKGIVYPKMNILSLFSHGHYELLLNGKETCKVFCVLWKKITTEGFETKWVNDKKCFGLNIPFSFLIFSRSSNQAIITAAKSVNVTLGCDQREEISVEFLMQVQDKLSSCSEVKPLLMVLECSMPQGSSLIIDGWV